MSLYFNPSIEVLARISRKRFILPTALIVLIIYASFPLLNRQNAVDEAYSSPELAAAVEALKATVKSAGPEERRNDTRNFLRVTNQFSQIKIPYMAYWVDEPTPHVKGEIGPPVFSLRYDQIVLAGAMIIALVITFSTLYPPSEVAAARVAQVQAPIPVPQLHSTARQVFSHEVKHAEFRAETLFKRSTYLLTAGVLMSFVGVVVFYATLPDPTSEGAQTTYWISALRSAGMLIFLEAIAWFLLRQYRNLIEDFKSFHRIYMKRANYLAAITVLDKDIVRSEDLLLVAALIGEDFSGKLMSGETTESLENMKNEGVNPVFNLVHDALGKAFSRSASVQGAKSSDKP